MCGGCSPREGFKPRLAQSPGTARRAYPPGAPPDVAIRPVAGRLSEGWGRQIVVDNRPGAAGNIGTATVARAAPDGYTVLMAAPPHAVNVYLYESTGYDPVADF